MDEPKLIKGGHVIDDRGEISFVNDFGFTNVKRFYMVENHKQGFIRAWHGHKYEAKYVLVVKGTALLAAVHIDSWENPSKETKIHRFVISERDPSILYIPAGYANGFMSLSPDTKIVFFSTSTLEATLKDDIRFNAHYWNPWNIEER